ncbi:MAG TPA: amidohydrolase family protein, partial [Porticoccaceae bacterium]
MQNYDVIIRGGTVVDGLGGKPYVADIAIKDGVIDRIGVIEGKGREDVDASGCIVTPGFVDIHTHFDGQATWASRMAPASNHGVTTVITGNCGVGFAPCRESDREALIKLMEGVEDIPGAVMSEGLPWSWQSFPEYMDYLAERSFDVNIGVQLPHAPLRVFVMGQR